MNAEELLDRLGRLGIETRTVEHPPVFTVEEAKALRGEIKGCHTKNLFLRNKKGAMWLLVCPENRAVDLKRLGERLESGRLSFGSADRLMKYLGVIPGAVSPFAIVNDTEEQVRVVLDRELLECDRLNFHPLDNSKTTSLSVQDFLQFLETERHGPELIDLV